MANTYTYSGPATRWSEGDPTAVDYLNVSRVNSDHLYEALNTILVTSSVTSGAASALVNGTTATTQGSSDNSTKIATTEWVVANATTNPGGSNTQIQYNNSGAFGGSANLTFDGSTLKVFSSSTAAFNPDAGTGLPSLVLHNNATDTDNQNVGIGFELGPSGSNGQTRIDAVRDGTAAATDMAFSTRQSSGNLYQRMLIKSTGKIMLSNAGTTFEYIGHLAVSTTWQDLPGPMYLSGRAGFIHYKSLNNHNGATSDRSLGYVWASGNEQGGTTYFRYTITTPIANSSGYWGWANLSFRNNPDNSKKIQVQRSSNSQNASGAYFWYQSMAGGYSV
jgi:hypothetical protein